MARLLARTAIPLANPVGLVVAASALVITGIVTDGPPIIGGPQDDMASAGVPRAGSHSIGEPGGPGRR